MKARTRVIGAALLLAVAGMGWFLRPWLFPPGLPEGILEGFGRIEGTEVTVSSKLTGRILKLPLSEGDHVGTGDLVAQLSADEITARLGQASSHVAAAEAQAYSWPTPALPPPCPEPWSPRPPSPASWFFREHRWWCWWT